MEVEILYHGDGYTVCDLEGWSYGEFATYADAAEYAHDRGWRVVLF